MLCQNDLLISHPPDSRAGQMSRSLKDPLQRDLRQAGLSPGQSAFRGFRCVTKVSGSGVPRAFPEQAAAPAPPCWSLPPGGGR